MNFLPGILRACMCTCVCTCVYVCGVGGVDGVGGVCVHVTGGWTYGFCLNFYFMFNKITDERFSTTVALNQSLKSISLMFSVFLCYFSSAFYNWFFIGNCVHFGAVLCVCWFHVSLISSSIYDFFYLWGYQCDPFSYLTFTHQQWMPAVCL